jgi:hypothetical protein
MMTRVATRASQFFRKTERPGSGCLAWNSCLETRGAQSVLRFFTSHPLSARPVEAAVHSISADARAPFKVAVEICQLPLAASHANVSGEALRSKGGGRG